MKSRIVWQKFQWQRIGRFWLYYFHPGMGEWRYTNVSKYLEARDSVKYYEGFNKGFRSGKV